MLTEQEKESVEQITGWKGRDHGQKFVVSSFGHRASHEDLGGDPTYYELVLLLQKTLTLALWVEPGRYNVQVDLERRLEGWNPPYIHRRPPLAKGIMDGGYAVDFLLDVPTNEFLDCIQEIRTIVDVVHAKLVEVGMPL